MHEVAHGYSAYKFGDDTAKNAGRLSLNPLSHLDPFGSVLLPIIMILTNFPVVFGYAKPVPVNFHRLKFSKYASLVVALSGPLVNLCLLVLGLIMINFFYFSLFFYYLVIINTLLLAFNLIPIPPLDGSRLLRYFLPEKAMLFFDQVEKYGILIIFLLLYLGCFDPFFNLIFKLVASMIK